jgi:hypothetical protein
MGLSNLLTLLLGSTSNSIAYFSGEGDSEMDARVANNSARSSSFPTRCSMGFCKICENLAGTQFGAN